MTNIFDDEGESFFAVVNGEDVYSLWPVRIEPVPDGWRVVHGPRSRAECLSHIEQHWTTSLLTH